MYNLCEAYFRKFPEAELPIASFLRARGCVRSSHRGFLSLSLSSRTVHGVESDDTRVQEKRRPGRAEAAHLLLEGHAQEFHSPVEDEHRGG